MNKGRITNPDEYQMYNKEEQIQLLEKDLENMKKSNKSAWDTYGSELCAGKMIQKEHDLQRKIKELKERLF